MAIRIVPLGDREVEEARAFNARMEAAGAPGDFISDRPGPSGGGIVRQQYVALDGRVHGGVLECAYPAWLNGAEMTAYNYQSPISEGIIDRRYGLVAVLLIKFMHQQGRHLFMVGMGADTRLPRLMTASGWVVRSVPFLFRVHQASRLLAEMPLLRSSRVRAMGATLLAASGAGRLGAGLLQGKGLGARLATRDYSIGPLEEWGGWADELWERFLPHCSFAVQRNRRALAEMYPTSDDRVLRFVVKRRGRIVGWSACLNTQMVGSLHFGNLRVATILDAVAPPESMEATIALTDGRLRSVGADLVVSNQAHGRWQEAFRACGFLEGPSNYQFAASRALAEEIGSQAEGGLRVHLNRGDAEGRIHL